MYRTFSSCQAENNNQAETPQRSYTNLQHATAGSAALDLAKDKYHSLSYQNSMI